MVEVGPLKVIAAPGYSLSWLACKQITPSHSRGHGWNVPDAMPSLL